MSDSYTLHFIALQGSLEKPSAQEFMKYIVQQSPAQEIAVLLPGNSNSLVFQFLSAYCWFKSRCSTVNPVWHHIITLDVADGLCYNPLLFTAIGPEIFARTAAGLIVWTAAEDWSDLVVLLDGSTLAGDSTTDMYDFSDESGVLTNTLVNQRTKTVWKRESATCYYYMYCYALSVYYYSFLT